MVNIAFEGGLYPKYVFRMAMYDTTFIMIYVISNYMCYVDLFGFSELNFDALKF